jgi:hypothetical protein
MIVRHATSGSLSGSRAGCTNHSFHLARLGVRVTGTGTVGVGFVPVKPGPRKRLAASMLVVITRDDRHRGVHTATATTSTEGHWHVSARGHNSSRLPPRCAGAKFWQCVCDCQLVRTWPCPRARGLLLASDRRPGGTGSAAARSSFS